MPFNPLTVQVTAWTFIFLDPPDGYPVINGFMSGSIYRIIENEKSTLSCSVRGGNPLAKPEWHCERIDNITSNEHITDNGKVTSYLSWIAKRTDGKTCTCQIGHILANVTVYINIDVLCKWHIFCNVLCRSFICHTFLIK